MLVPRFDGKFYLVLIMTKPCEIFQMFIRSTHITSWGLTTCASSKIRSFVLYVLGIWPTYFGPILCSLDVNQPKPLKVTNLLNSLKKYNDQKSKNWSRLLAAKWSCLTVHDQFFLGHSTTIGRSNGFYLKMTELLVGTQILIDRLKYLKPEDPTF